MNSEVNDIEDNRKATCVDVPVDFGWGRHTVFGEHDRAQMHDQAKV